MKTIKLYVVKDEISNTNNHFYDFKNSLLSFEDDKYYFKSKFSTFEYEYSTKEIINFSCEILNFDEELSKTLENILRESYKKAMEISEEEISDLPSFINSEIKTTIQKYQYETCNSVFYFVAELFYKYLMGHHLKNGNKRLSFSFMVSTLWYFGYYLKWTKNIKKYEEKYKNIIEKWVNNFQNTSDNKSNEWQVNIKDIEKFIKENVVIGLHFRNKKNKEVKEIVKEAFDQENKEVLIKQIEYLKGQ